MRGRGLLEVDVGEEEQEEEGGEEEPALDYLQGQRVSTNQYLQIWGGGLALLAKHLNLKLLFNQLSLSLN